MALVFPIIESIFVLACCGANAGLQAYSFYELNGITPTNSSITEAKHLLLASFIAQIIAALFMLVAIILAITHRTSPNAKKWVFVALVLATIFLFGGGVLGAISAMNLQCFRKMLPVETAWQMASISAVIGIVGTVLVLIIQTYMAKESIKKALREQLITEYVKQPLYVPVKKETKPPAVPQIPPRGLRRGFGSHEV